MEFDETKGKFIVSMSGKEYLNYKKYQDNKAKRFGKTLVRFFYSLRYFLMALFVYTLGRWFINTLYPIKYVPTEFGVLSINGIVIPYLLIYMLAFMIGLAWIFHGFGFIIVKR